MLKTYRIIPLVFILFLFGLTLITVSPVFAEDSPEFVACKQIKKDLKGKKNCFKNLARDLQVAVDKAEAEKVELQELVEELQEIKRQLGAAVNRAEKGRLAAISDLDLCNSRKVNKSSCGGAREWAPEGWRHTQNDEMFSCSGVIEFVELHCSKYGREEMKKSERGTAAFACYAFGYDGNDYP